MKKSIFLLSFLAFFLTQEGYCEDCPVTKQYTGGWTYCPVKVNETECIKLETNEKIKCLENKADKGDVEAMFFLGAIYKYDLHQAKKAIKWFKKAGDTRSFHEIGGIFYAIGLDHCSRAYQSRNPQDKSLYDEKSELIKCDKWLDKAAQLDHEWAVLAAAIGSETLREKWSIELAKKGDCMRLFMLADDYEKRDSLIPNSQKADQLYKQAADLGCPKRRQPCKLPASLSKYCSVFR